MALRRGGPVPAARRPCASSKSSTAAARPDTNPPPVRSGLTHHGRTITQDRPAAIVADVSPPPWQRAGSSNLLAQTDADPPRLPQNARPYTRRWLRSRQQHPAQRPVVPITMIATAARAELQSPYRAWNRPSLTSRDFVRWRLLDADRRRTSPVYAPRRPTNLHTSRRCRGSKNTYSIV